jgi:hypothetical protein
MALSVDMIEFTTTGRPRQAVKMATPDVEASGGIFDSGGRVEGFDGARRWRCPLEQDVRRRVTNAGLRSQIRSSW